MLAERRKKNNMKQKILFLCLVSLTLVGCSKTSELYGKSQYNSVNFDENYYLNWDKVDEIEINNRPINYNVDYKVQKSNENSGVIDLKIGSQNYNPENDVYIDKYAEVHDKEFGYNHCMSKTTNNKDFKYGVTSKLFDGRVWCEGLYNLSRVQVNKSGFAMRFTKYLLDAKYLAFSVRGGTDFLDSEEFGRHNITIDFVWSFYRLNGDAYERINYNFKNLNIPVDNNTETAFVFAGPGFMDFAYEIGKSEAFSIEWSCYDLPDNVTDDYRIKEKHHLSLMLYELIIGESVWSR